MYDPLSLRPTGYSSPHYAVVPLDPDSTNVEAGCLKEGA